MYGFAKLDGFAKEVDSDEEPGQITAGQADEDLVSFQTDGAVGQEEKKGKEDPAEAEYYV